MGDPFVNIELILRFLTYTSVVRVSTETVLPLSGRYSADLAYAAKIPRTIPREKRKLMMISVHPRVAATGRTMGTANQIAIVKAILTIVENAVEAVIEYCSFV